MEYLGDKLSVAHSQVSGWVGNVRRSFHGALNFLSTSVERGGRGDGGTGDFKRTNSLRSLASRSRESIRRFSLRSQQRLSLRRRTAPNTPIAVSTVLRHSCTSQMWIYLVRKISPFAVFLAAIMLTIAHFAYVVVK